MADLHVPIRAGTDIAFLGGLIRHVLENDLWFHEYVCAYTNASTLLREDFLDTEDLDGVFSGLHENGRSYDDATWQYQGMEVAAASGERDADYDESVQRSGHGESHGSGGPALRGNPERDETLRDPRTVFRPCAAITPGTPRRWSSGSVGCRRTCWLRSPTH